MKGTAGFRPEPGGKRSLVPERAIIAILPALSVGFIAGIIVSALQLNSTPTLIVGVAGAIIVLLAAFSSVFGVGGDRSEKATVGVLRALCAVALYGCMFLFITGFLREGNFGALVWVAVGAAFVIVLMQLRVRDRGELQAD